MAIVVPNIPSDFCPDNEAGIKEVYVIAMDHLGPIPDVDTGTRTISSPIPLTNSQTANWQNWEFLEDSVQHSEEKLDSGRFQHLFTGTIPEDSPLKRYIFSSMSAGCCKYAIIYTDANDLQKVVFNLSMRYDFQTGQGGDNDDLNQYEIEFSRIGNAAYVYSPVMNPVPSLTARYWTDFEPTTISFEADVSFSTSSSTREVVVEFVDTIVDGTDNLQHTQILSVDKNDAALPTSGTVEFLFAIPTTTFYDKVKIYSRDETQSSPVVSHNTGSIYMDGSPSDMYTIPTSVAATTSILVTDIPATYTRAGTNKKVYEHVGGQLDVFSTGGPNNDYFFRFTLDGNLPNSSARQRSEFTRDARYTGEDWDQLDNIGYYVPIGRDGTQNGFANWCLFNNGMFKYLKRGQGCWFFYWARMTGTKSFTSEVAPWQAGKGVPGPGSPSFNLEHGGRLNGGYTMLTAKVVNTDFDITSFDSLGSGQGRGRSENFHDLGPDAEINNTWKPYLMYYYPHEEDGIIQIWCNWQSVFFYQGQNIYKTDENGAPYTHPHINPKNSFYDVNSSWISEGTKSIDQAKIIEIYEQPGENMYDLSYFQSLATTPSA